MIDMSLNIVLLCLFGIFLILLIRNYYGIRKTIMEKNSIIFSKYSKKVQQCQLIIGSVLIVLGLILANIFMNVLFFVSIVGIAILYVLSASFVAISDNTCIILAAKKDRATLNSMRFYKSGNGKIKAMIELQLKNGISITYDLDTGLDEKTAKKLSETVCKKLDSDILA